MSANGWVALALERDESLIEDYAAAKEIDAVRADVAEQVERALAI